MQESNPPPCHPACDPEAHPPRLDYYSSQQLLSGLPLFSLMFPLSLFKGQTFMTPPNPHRTEWCCLPKLCRLV